MLKDYFELDIRLLQNAVRWSTESVKEAISIYEIYLPNDSRPQYAFEVAMDFLETGKRTNKLRKIAMDSYKASRETQIEQATYAANAASLFAAIAYTHPFRDKNQAKHVMGPIVYSALAIEVEYNDKNKSEHEIEQAILRTDEKIKRLVSEYPRQEIGKKRVDELFYKLDFGIINRKY